MPGPSKKPTNLRILEGNPSRRPINEAEPQPEAGVGCPGWLSKGAKAEWKRIVPVLEACRVLTKADVAIVASYCQAWADYEAITRTLNAMPDKTLEGGPHGRRVAPEVSLQKQYFEVILKAGAKLGLSPSDRTGIKVNPSGKGGKWSDLK